MNDQDAVSRVRELNAQFAELIVSHPQYTTGWKRVVKLLGLTGTGAKPSGMMLLGESGTGKSTMSKHLAAHGNQHCVGHQQRVIYATLNGSSALGSVYSSILDKMGDQAPEHGTNPRKLQRLVAGLTSKDTHVLIIDETQHLITKRFNGDANLREVTNALKSILDAGTTSLILAGLPEARALWADDPQLRRRFLPPVELRDFTPDDREAWRDVIKEMVGCCARVGIGKPEISLGELSDRMMLASLGKISNAARIIKEAGEMAIARTCDALTITLLHEACVETIAEEDGLPDAFILKAAQMQQLMDRRFGQVSNDNILAKRTPTVGQVLSARGAL